MVVVDKKLEDHIVLEEDSLVVPLQGQGVVEGNLLEMVKDNNQKLVAGHSMNCQDLGDCRKMLLMEDICCLDLEHLHCNHYVAVHLEDKYLAAHTKIAELFV